MSTTQAKESENKSRRLEDLAESKKGLFAIDPTRLSVEPGFNERLDYGNIDQLAEDIAANGLETPLKIRKIKSSETIFIVHGHRRHRAITTKLIPAGRWHNEDGTVKPVDCYAEAQHTTDFDRLAGQLSSNTGLPYNLLEKAAGYKRLLEMDDSLKPADIARRFGESKQAVSDALRLSRDGSPVLHSAILNGSMSASTAIAIIKQAGADHQAQNDLFHAATASANGANHVTPKHLTPKHLTPAPASDADPAPDPTSNAYIDPNPGGEDGDSEDAAPSSFTLYVIEDAPEAPVEESPQHYHESDRLALSHPECFGLSLLHLLCASTSYGMAFGFRVNDHEHLPDVSSPSLGCEAQDGFSFALEAACRHAVITHDLQDDLGNLLFDALCEYFPEIGTPKEPERIPFVRASEAQSGSNHPGFQKTLNSTPASSDPGGSSFLDPQTFKAVEKVEKILEGLAEKGKGIEERITSVDIAIAIIRNERPATDLKNYLLGK